MIKDTKIEKNNKNLSKDDSKTLPKEMKAEKEQESNEK